MAAEALRRPVGTHGTTSRHHVTAPCHGIASGQGTEPLTEGKRGRGGAGADGPSSPLVRRGKADDENRIPFLFRPNRIYIQSGSHSELPFMGVLWGNIRRIALLRIAPRRLEVATTVGGRHGDWRSPRMQSCVTDPPVTADPPVNAELLLVLDLICSRRAVYSIQSKINFQSKSTESLVD